MSFDRIEEFKKVQLNGPDPADFAANTINLLTALGLGLQGLGLAKVELNLSPIAKIRQKLWKAKTPWFLAAACILLVTSVAMFLRVGLDQILLSKLSESSAKADSTSKQGTSLITQLSQAQEEAQQGNADQNILNLLKDRTVWPYLVNDTYAALDAGRPAKAEVGENVEDILKIPIGQRRLIQLKEMTAKTSIGATSPEGTGGARKISVSILVSVTNSDPSRFFNEPNGILEWLKVNADRPDAPYIIDTDSIAIPRWTEIVGGKRTQEKIGSDSDDALASGGSITYPDGAQPQKGGGAGAVRKRVRTEPAQAEQSQPGFTGGLGSGGADTESSSGDLDSGSGSEDVSQRRAITLVVREGEKLPPLDIETEARLPRHPILILGNEKYFEGTLTFTVTLKSPFPADLNENVSR